MEGATESATMLADMTITVCDLIAYMYLLQAVVLLHMLSKLFQKYIDWVVACEKAHASFSEKSMG